MLSLVIYYSPQKDSLFSHSLYFHSPNCHLPVLLGEKAERADAFFSRFIETGKNDAYVASLAKHERRSFDEPMVRLFDVLSHRQALPNPGENGRDNT